MWLSLIQKTIKMKLKIKLSTIVTIFQIVTSVLIAYYYETIGITNSILMGVVIWGILPIILVVIIQWDLVKTMYLNIVDMTYEVVFNGKTKNKEEGNNKRDRKKRESKQNKGVSKNKEQKGIVGINKKN